MKVSARSTSPSLNLRFNSPMTKIKLKNAELLFKGINNSFAC